MFKDKYRSWELNFHETFGSTQHIDLNVLQSAPKSAIVKTIEDINDNYSSVPGMFVELNADYSLVRCGITNDLSKIVNKIFDSTGAFMYVYSYMNSYRDDWHYSLGIAKQDLKRQMK